MNTGEPTNVDTEDDLEDWLESELLPAGAITVPEDLHLPSKIRWIVSDGANVVENQVLATFSFVENASGIGKEHVKSTNSDDGVEVASIVSGREDTDTSRSLPSESGDACVSTKAYELDGPSHRSSLSNTQADTTDSKAVISALTNGSRGVSIELVGRATEGSFVLRSVRHGTLRHRVPTDTVIEDYSAVLGTIESVQCEHSVVIHGLCVTCCQVVDDASTKRRQDVAPGNSKRQSPGDKPSDAPEMVVPGFITNNNAVLVDAKMSNEMELMELLRLLRKKKLCLVLDLDNTLIHSSCAKPPDDIDIPFIDMYSRSQGYKLHFDSEEDNRRYEAELESSILITRTLNEQDGRFFVNYYKLRPGVYEFLRNASERYELYLFTMGTRTHAQAALRILDPKGLLFGSRVFSRSETNNSYKSLCRIFPNYRNLLLILDDSEHIWMNPPGLIKVYPYYYFTDMSLIRNRDSRNLGRVSAALQAHCNYSNYVWHSLIMEIWNESESRERVTRDDDGFTIPMNLKMPKKRSPSFRYNNLLIANCRPSNIYRDTAGADSASVTQRLSDSAAARAEPAVLQEVRPAEPRPSDDKRVLSEVTNTGINTEADTRAHSADCNKDTKGTIPQAERVAVTQKDMEPTADACKRSESGDSSKTLPPNQVASPVDAPTDFAEAAPPTAPSTQQNSCMRKLRKIWVRDYDSQLPCVTRLLIEMHRRFFELVNVAGLTLERLKQLIGGNALPDVGVLLNERRKSVLRGVVLGVNRNDFRCPRTGEDVDFFNKSDLGYLAVRFGAAPPSVECSMTHYLNNNTSAVAPKAGVKRVHSQWLEACIHTWSRVDESLFDPETWKEPHRTFWDVMNAKK
ncbi:protein phosphatase family protein, putative [Babesia bigemina]|uniref:protein-serine/threonine phosphatase n=1 Tax=Babesia bigemina TaxID=5866 RepID=A0A061DBG5_BABBI|nr:protein phosphatase family protein, putative [Babesia bigemina]CDR96244.1 protein phosphatase family protein, putative [Babesia bigemina]|eukprot:XP_012768430.1 protein phosphatase family protein, putative [Babesia bigemina]